MKLDRSPGLGEAEVARRLAFLHRHLQDKIPLARVAAEAGVPIRTARRWLARYRARGPAGLARSPRPEAGSRKISAELVELVQGLALLKPPLSVATIQRRAHAIAEKKGWRPASYGSVRNIVRSLAPGVLMLAHQGAAAFRDKFELVHRHRAERPNEIWQCDHTQLDLLTLDTNGKAERPWLTTVIDDYSRAVAGYMVFCGAPSALNTALALRQAIWRKKEAAWPVCGIPEVLYVDHGSDFTSVHLEQAAADLHIQLIFSTVARPQGRGKVERLFGTVNTELLPELPGNIRNGELASSPRLSLPELDAAVGSYIIDTYNARVHSEIGATPVDAWRSDGWLPRMPETPEELDTLLVMVAKPRRVHRDGIRYQGLRFLDPTLAAYIGEPVTIRYDPRDVGEIRVFHKNVFLCRAVSPEYAGQSISLEDVQAARAAYRRQLRSEIRSKTVRVADYLPAVLRPSSVPKVPRKRNRLRTYFEDQE